MSFASDKLYNGYLRRNMPTIVSKVKVREIMMHLPCLTAHDRENIEAKRETYGGLDSAMLLLDCLKRRENWPEQFIEALEACEQRSLAAEIRAEYDTLRGINNSNPNDSEQQQSPPTTIVRAHVHAAPSASHPSIPESGANTQAAVAAPPAEAPAPPEPVVQAPPPLEVPVQPQTPPSSAAQVPVPKLEPVPEPPRSEAAPRPSTPPPSPVAPHTQATTTPPPQRETNSPQEPVENSESEIQDESVGNGDVEQHETDTPPCPDPLQTATTSTEVRPPQSPPPTLINLDVTDGSSFPMMTPERPPVQDTNPHVDLKPAAVLQPEETPERPASQGVESSPQTVTVAPASTLPGAAGMDTPLCDDNTAYLSKPGQLISVCPQNHGSPDIPAPSAPVQPYSGNSERLEISSAAQEEETSTHLSACSAVHATTVTTASALPCQENGIALNHNEPEENHNEPEENHYESLCQSLGNEVLMSEVHVSEEPSILNLDGQSTTPQTQIVNGEAAKEMTAAPPLSTSTVDTVSSVHTPSSENCHTSQPAPADPSPELKTLQGSEKTASRTPATSAKYILTAAGVGACALLMAWRFKKI